MATAVGPFEWTSTSSYKTTSFATEGIEYLREVGVPPVTPFVDHLRSITHPLYGHRCRHSDLPRPYTLMQPSKLTDLYLFCMHYSTI